MAQVVRVSHVIHACKWASLFDHELSIPSNFLFFSFSFNLLQSLLHFFNFVEDSSNTAYSAKKEMGSTDDSDGDSEHEFQANYDLRSVQKLSETIESQQEELHCAQAEELQRRDQQLLHAQLLQQNSESREALIIVSMKWKKWRSSRVPPSTRLQNENQSRIRILFWNVLARYRNCRTKLIAWMIQEIFKMLNQYAVPVDQCHSHLIQFLVEC